MYERNERLTRGTLYNLDLLILSSKLPKEYSYSDNPDRRSFHSVIYDILHVIDLDV